MRNHTLTILAVILTAVVVFFAAELLIQRPAMAPTTENAPSGSVVVPISIVTLRENTSSSPSITVEYPQFSSLPKSFNELISSTTMSRLADFKKTAAENEAAREATADPKAAITPNDYSFMASWQASQVNSRYVSFVIRFDSYTGGANENQEIQTFNYDIEHRQVMTLADLFPGTSTYLKTISQLAREQLRSSLTSTSPDYDPTSMLNAGTEPIIDNFQNFTFTDSTVTFYFPKYAVAPGAFGEQRVTLPRSAIN